MRIRTTVAIAAVALTVIAVFALFPRPISFGEAVIEVAGARLKVEIADTQDEQERGLMFRDSLAEDLGMLFVFDREGSYGFWMLNVRFPLDIIWFDVDRKVVFMAKDVPPCAALPCPVYTPDKVAKYVLELRGGWTERHGVALNSTFSILTG